MSAKAPMHRPCFACGHLHDPESDGQCWEAACLPECPAHAAGRREPQGAGMSAATACGNVFTGPDFDGSLMSHPCGGDAEFVVIFVVREPMSEHDEGAQSIRLCDRCVGLIGEDVDVDVVRVLSVATDEGTQA